MQQPQSQLVTLILGGARSGKSRYAQQLAEPARHVTFVATAEARNDAEMAARIGRHQADRPNHWTTMEEPLRLADAIARAAHTPGTILVDCLTLFAANLLEAEQLGQSPAGPIDDLCAVLLSATEPVILVSNEVGSGVVPEYASGRRFRDLAGEINQRVAAVAGTVVLMVAGLPLTVKGSLAGKLPGEPA